MLHVFETEAAHAAAAAGYRQRQARGIALRHLTPDEIGDLEPALRPGTGRPLVRGVLLSEAGQITSPRALRLALAAAFAARGGRTETAAALRTDGATLHLRDGRARAFDRLVIAAGVRSGSIAAGLGVRVPLIAERGYHLQFAEAADLLRRSVLNVDRRVVFSPHDDGLRMTTGAEFTHPDRPHDPEWMAPLFEAARGLSPRIPPLSQARRWSGDRPSTPDSLPVIGPAPRDPRVLLAYGHGHLGLTLAAPTAALIADLVAGRRPAVDLAPYAADRPA
jgi:D-amino-acid dehydrogenase